MYTEPRMSGHRADGVLIRVERRRWSDEEKLAISKETTQPGVIVAVVTRRQGIGASQLYTWRRQLLKRCDGRVRAGRACPVRTAGPVCRDGADRDPPAWWFHGIGRRRTLGLCCRWAPCQRCCARNPARNLLWQAPLCGVPIFLPEDHFPISLCHHEHRVAEMTASFAVPSRRLGLCRS